MTGGATPTRVLLADDLPLFRRAIASLLDAQPDFEVVGQADNGLEAVELARSLDPAVVVLDVEMPVLNGIGAARLIREQLPHIKVVMLTVSDDDDHLLDAIRLGVHGYLLKDLHLDELFARLRAVLADEVPVAPALVGRLVAALRSGTSAPTPDAADPSPQDVLSARELEIMQWVASGLGNKEVAQRLVIGEGTVKTHVHHALRKLGVDNRIQAAALLVRHGLATR